MSFTGKVAVITGASMGIGEAIAARLVAQGAQVVLSSRELERAEAARQRLGALDRTLAVACDVRRREQIEHLLAATLERFGRVDLWVNNAGFGLVDSVEKMEMASCRALFDTNLFGAIECMQVVSPVLKQQRGGAIVNISSLAGSIAVPYMSAYGASKHALNCITRAARLELAPYGVQVSLVSPGYVRTEFNAHSLWGRESLRIAGSGQRGVTPEAVAEAVVRAWLGKRREIFVPRSAGWMAALYRMMPGLFNWGMMKMLRRMDREQHS